MVDHSSGLEKINWYETKYLRALFVPNTVIGTEPWTCTVIHRHACCVQRFDNTLDSAIHTKLSHIAASFIDWEAKTSTVMSCSRPKAKCTPESAHVDPGIKELEFNRVCCMNIGKVRKLSK